MPSDLRYGDVVHDYRPAGWTGCLPLPYRAKQPPPLGWTGRAAPYPDRPQIEQWRARYGRGGVALRLPPGVLGLDVDAYRDKPGLNSWAALCDRLGAPTPTWVSTSRADGSGIRLYRVPGGIRWSERNAGPGIELIHAGHRYIVAWPSIHPEGRQYRWWAPDGTPADRIPCVNELPWLPNAWVRRLSARYVPPQQSRPITHNGAAPRGYAAAALHGAIDDLVAMSRDSGRNNAVNRKAFALGGLVGAGLLDERTVREALLDAATVNGLVADDGERSVMATINSGLQAGIARPRTPAGAAR